MVVRAGAAKPDIRSVEEFRKMLLAMNSIAYSDSASGIYLSTILFAKLGVADQVAGKSRKVRGPPSGEPVAAVVARGEAEIGFQQVSELINVPGVTFVGPIPSELQPDVSFAGALTSTAREPEAARALIRFLASPESAATILKAGLTPVSRTVNQRDLNSKWAVLLPRHLPAIWTPVSERLPVPLIDTGDLEAPIADPLTLPHSST